MILKGRLKTDFLFSDDLFYFIGISNERRIKVDRALRPSFLTWRVFAWGFVFSFLSWIARFSEMGFRMRENGRRGEIYCFI